MILIKLIRFLFDTQIFIFIMCFKKNSCWCHTQKTGGQRKHDSKIYKKRKEFIGGRG